MAKMVKAGDELKFFDVKAKKSFKTTKWKERIIKGRRFAVTKSPFGTHEAFRILPKKR